MFVPLGHDAISYVLIKILFRLINCSVVSVSSFNVFLVCRSSMVPCHVFVGFVLHLRFFGDIIVGFTNIIFGNASCKCQFLEVVDQYSTNTCFINEICN